MNKQDYFWFYQDQKDFIKKETEKLLEEFLEKCIVYKIDQNKFEIRVTEQDRKAFAKRITKVFEREVF